MPDTPQPDAIIIPKTFEEWWEDDGELLSVASGDDVLGHVVRAAFAAGVASQQAEINRIVQLRIADDAQLAAKDAEVERLTKQSNEFYSHGRERNLELSQLIHKQRRYKAVVEAARELIRETDNPTAGTHERRRITAGLRAALSALDAAEARP